MFEEKSERAKRRDVAELSVGNDNCTNKFLMAAKFSAKKTMNKDLAQAIAHIMKNPVLTVSSESVQKATPEEALAYLLDNNLSKQQYVNMRLECKAKKSDIWPRYGLIVDAKKKVTGRNRSK